MKVIPLSAAKPANRSARGYALVDDDNYPRLVGSGAWCLRTTNGLSYAVRSQDGHQVAMHREVLGLVFGDPLQADHIDGDGLNNQRSNLRIVTAAQNSQNRRSRPGSTSIFRGVNWAFAQEKWVASGRVGELHRTLGYFDDELHAALAAERFRREHLPFAMPDAALLAVLTSELEAIQRARSTTHLTLVTEPKGDAA